MMLQWPGQALLSVVKQLLEPAPGSPPPGNAPGAAASLRVCWFSLKISVPAGKGLSVPKHRSCCAEGREFPRQEFGCGVRRSTSSGGCGAVVEGVELTCSVVMCRTVDSHGCWCLSYNHM